MAHNWLSTFGKKYKNQKQLIEELYMPAIIDSYSRVRKTDGINALLENAIRDEFYMDFEEKNKLTKVLINNNTLSLGNENRIPRLRRRIDLSFFISDYGHFILECKRMISVQPSTIQAGYIAEGLERFTQEAYAKSDKYAGIIGFVLNVACKPVCEATKQQVSGHSTFIKNNSRLLSEKCGGHDTSFQSKHTRLTVDNIHLYHLFFKL